ncbi:MAG: Phosphate transport system permease protein PstA [Candidatus Angelobacter sp.]|nr:Phosphate transport system permease protein PstA [Candidatus Angelobacter sp.]MCU1333238.1 Phosphate transport system permease protein PstA [Candidatus Angelobacter sp.]
MPKLHTISLRRKLTSGLAVGLITLAALVVTVPLFLILGTVIMRGIGELNWAFLTQIPKPVGETGGGMANAIIGSMMLLGLASLIGVPLGVGAGVFLAEYGRNKWGNIVRFTSDVLNGVPSIVIGLTAYALVVVVQKHFSMLAGSVALGIMMVPTIARTTEEVLLLVPQSIREAALGLGIPRWRTIVSVVLRTASAGIVTSIMLAFARVAGETAPLMFTSFGNMYWNMRPDQPTASLPLQIFTYAVMPYEQAHRQAWTGALVLISMIMLTVILFRFIASRGTIKGAS